MARVMRPVTETYVAGTCPREETMFAFMDGAVDAVSQLNMLRHLSECEACRSSLAQMAAMLGGVAKILQDPSSEQLPGEEAWGAAGDRVIAEVRESGLIERRMRFDAGDVARRMGRLAGKVAKTAAKTLWTGTRAAYSATATLVRFGAGIGRARERTPQRTRWRLAW